MMQLSFAHMSGHAAAHPNENVWAHPVAWHESVGYLGALRRTKIEAFTAHLKNYPDSMSLWGKESFAAEAFRASDKKARKLSRQKAALKQRAPASSNSQQLGGPLNEPKLAIGKLQRIQKLWVQLGRTKLNSPEYQEIMTDIRSLSEEYHALINASQKSGKSK